MKAAEAPPINGVVETVLYADDLERTARFYREVMGLKPMKGDPERFQALDSGANRVLLVFKRGATLSPMPMPNGGFIPAHNGSGPQHIAFAIPEADYAAWRQRLIDFSIPIESETRWERGGRSIYFRDPDDHLIELVTPGIWSNY